ncbi:MAG TPA: nucleotide sugar dehydrogenase [Candidatus Absconditabacterales bacterium]|nr:nucleotide sugar dehydrogenase [Candidatus Absconditabacterales bacterium]
MKKIAVVGLGYVGLPLAYNFDKAGMDVVGLDISDKKIEDLKNGIDSTNEIGSKISKSKIKFTNDFEDLKDREVIIVTVPTPINKQKNPDFVPLQKSSEAIGKILQKGQIVVYESTVYPGCTEEICLPILAKESGLKYNEEFFLGYSPERINPGDKVHTVENIIKVVSGSTDETANKLVEMYNTIIKAGTHKAPSMKVAEASKVIENTQRDINIGLMNELSCIFDKIGINTDDVLAAAGTKWNFLKFFPGLVGGHCIGVDPYRLAYKAEEVGYNPELILAGRRINDNMPILVANSIVKMLIQAGKKVNGSNILVLGLTFKENVPDFRNSKVSEMIKELKDFGINIKAYDPYYKSLTKYDMEELNIKESEVLKNIEGKYDGVVYAVSHQEFKSIDVKQFLDDGIVFDVKGDLDENDFEFYKKL